MKAIGRDRRKSRLASSIRLLGKYIRQFIADICRRRYAKKYLEIGVQAGAKHGGNCRGRSHRRSIPAFGISANLAAGKKMTTTPSNVQ